MIFFLRILPIEFNTLIINAPKKPKQPKETNWKQKNQKPQNENICLTSVNAENNCKFQIVYFQSKCIEVVALRKQNVPM